MAKDLGKIDELRIALNALYLWQRSLNLAITAAKKELDDLIKSQ